VLALPFTETEEFSREVPFATPTIAGLAKTPTTGVFAAGTAFGPAVEGFVAGTATAVLTECALAAETVDALFVPEIAAFGLDATGFAEACAEAVFAVATTGFTETAAFTFGAAVVVFAFAPFGDGLPACALLVAGCTLTVAGAAGFCTAVGVCANAAADRSMSVPRVRII